MNQPEDEKDPDKGNDFSDYGRARPQAPPDDRGDGSGTGSWVLRGCGVAIGIAALLFLFVVGTCFLG